MVYFLHRQLEPRLSGGGGRVLQVRCSVARRLHPLHALACEQLLGFCLAQAFKPSPLPPFCSPVPKKVANFPVGIWSGSFLILSAIDHLLVVLPRVRCCLQTAACGQQGGTSAVRLCYGINHSTLGGCLLS